MSPLKHLPVLLLAAAAAGCASTTAPVVIHQVAPPGVSTAGIERIALLPGGPPAGEDEALAGILEKEIGRAIEGTGLYKVAAAPRGTRTANPADVVEAAQAAEADMLIEFSIASRKTGRAGSTLEVAYSFFSGPSGEELLSKRSRASGGEAADAAGSIAGEIARSLIPHAVERTLLLEYGQCKLTRVGVELARKGIWDQAERKWWLAVRMNQSDPAAYHNLGVAFERRGFYGRAKTAYENAFVRNPQSTRYAEDIDRVQKLLGQAK